MNFKTRTIMVRLALVALPSVCLASRFVAPENIAGVEFETTAFEFSGSDFNLENVTLQSFPERWCDNCEGPSDDERTTDNVILFQGTYSDNCFKCGYSELALMNERYGSKGLMWYSYMDPGHERTVIHSFPSWENAAGIPAVEVGQDDADAILQLINQKTTVVVNMYPTENVWLGTYGTVILVLDIIVSILGFIVLALNFKTWVLFIGPFVKEGKYTLAVVVLSLELVSNLIRVVYAAVDPLWTREIYTYALSRYLLTLSVPFSCMSSVVLFLAWNNMMGSFNQRIGQESMLNRRRMGIFIATGAVIVTFDLVLSSFAIFAGKVTWTIYSVLGLSFFTSVVAIMFLYYGKKLSKTLKGLTNSRVLNSTDDNALSSQEGSKDQSYSEYSKDKTSAIVTNFVDEEGNVVEQPKVNIARKKHTKKKTSKKAQHLRIAYIVQMAGFFMLLSVVFMLLSGVNQVFFVPVGRAIIWPAAWVCLTMASYYRISFFSPPKK